MSDGSSAAISRATSGSMIASSPSGSAYLQTNRPHFSANSIASNPVSIVLRAMVSVMMPPFGCPTDYQPGSCVVLSFPAAVGCGVQAHTIRGLTWAQVCHLLGECGDVVGVNPAPIAHLVTMCQPDISSEPACLSRACCLSYHLCHPSLVFPAESLPGSCVVILAA